MRRLLATAIIAAAAWPAAQTVHAATGEPEVPVAIRVPAGHKLFLTGHATGVQVYRCDPAPSGVAWTFVGPWATLHDERGKLLATHFSGPTWEARDRSKVVGSRIAGVTVDANAIPWLLLSAASTTVGRDGDRLADTTFIQRTATSGGLEPPAADCNPATVNRWVEVPYTADYAFWKATGGADR